VRACARACVFQMRRPGDSKMLCSDSNCRSRKHYRKAAAAAVDSELVSVPSSPAARAEPHGDAGPDVDVPLPRPSRRKRKWEQRQLATCAAAPADLKPVSARSQPAAPPHTLCPSTNVSAWFDSPVSGRFDLGPCLRSMSLPSYSTFSYVIHCRADRR
jgi:hypothetical protein